jgi:glycerophosphoryl diester phosphodiesterase
VNVEIKNSPNDEGFDATLSLADDVATALTARGEPGRFLVSCFHLPTLDRVRAVRPGLATGWLVVGVPDVDDAIATARGHGHQAIHPHVDAVTERLLSGCHEAGIACNTWTCDEPARMRELAAWGVDGICTNVPEVCLAVLGRRRPSAPSAGGA